MEPERILNLEMIFESRYSHARAQKLRATNRTLRHHCEPYHMKLKFANSYTTVIYFGIL
jgi:hypothetical protein